MEVNNGLIIQYFIGYAANGANGALCTMPISFSNTNYTVVQTYFTTATFYNALPATYKKDISKPSQCFLGAYGLSSPLWAKVISIGF